MVHELMEQLKQLIYYTLSYMDDIIMLFNERFQSILCGCIQQALYVYNALSFNRTKTEVVLFTKIRKVKKNASTKTIQHSIKTFSVSYLTLS